MNTNQDPDPGQLSKGEVANVRQSFRRRAALRMLSRLIALPALLVFGVAVAAADRSDLLENVPILRALFVAVGIGLGALAVWKLGSDAKSVFRDDPLLLKAELLRPALRGDALERALEGSSGNLAVEVVAAYRLAATGEVIDVTSTWRGIRDLPSWGRIRKRVVPGNDVILVCSPQGAAVNRLAELLAKR